MSNKKINPEEKNNLVSVFVSSGLYSLESVYDAAYNFLDEAYVLLDGDPGDIIEVRLKGKNKLKKWDLDDLGFRFFNELINSGIRTRISKNNRIIREYIVSAALIGASKDLQERIKKKSEKITGDSESDKQERWDNDPLGIAVSWEEKYEKDKSEE